MENLFQSVFKPNFTGSTLKQDLIITLEEAYCGTVKEVELSRKINIEGKLIDTAFQKNIRINKGTKHYAKIIFDG